MAKTPLKVTTIRLTESQREFLETVEAKTGNDPSSTIRSLIQHAMVVGLPGEQSPAPTPVTHIGMAEEAIRARVEAERRAREAAEEALRERQRKVAELKAQLAELEGGGGTSGYAEHEVIPYGENDDDFEMPPDPDGGVASPQIAAALKGPAFSLTQPAGLRDDLDRPSVIGDPKGNVIRENYAFMAKGRRR